MSINVRLSHDHRIKIHHYCSCQQSVVHTRWRRKYLTIDMFKFTDVTASHVYCRSNSGVMSTVESNMLNDKPIESCLSRFDSGAYSRLQLLRAISHSVGAHTESLHPGDDNSSSSEDEDDERQAPVPTATTSGASESATAAATTPSDDCCDVLRSATCWLRTGAMWTCAVL